MPYVQIDPEFKRTSTGSETPEYPINYQNAAVANIELSDADEPVIVKEIEYVSDIKDAGYFVVFCGSIYCGGGASGKIILNTTYPNSNYAIKIQNTKSYIGLHTFTINKITLAGMNSGQYRYVTGLPTTFNFKIK